jgi:hypothetical protein
MVKLRMTIGVGQEFAFEGEAPIADVKELALRWLAEVTPRGVQDAVQRLTQSSATLQQAIDAAGTPRP